MAIHVLKAWHSCDRMHDAAAAFAGSRYQVFLGRACIGVFCRWHVIIVPAAIRFGNQLASYSRAQVKSSRD